MQVMRLPPELVAQYVAGGTSSPVTIYGGVEEGRVYACGGLLWENGRCWGWLDVFADVGSHTRLLVSWARRILRQARQVGEKEVFVWRDDWHPSSERLLTILGFELCGCDAETGKEIYACPVWKP